MNRYFLDDQKAPLKKLIWQIFFVFFFVYEVQPFGVPDMLTSRKIVFYIAGFTFITRFLKRFNSKTFDDVNFKRTSKKLISIGFVVFLWQTLITLLHSGTGSGQPMWGKTLLFLLLTSFFCTFSYFFFNNIKQFLLAMFYATVIQSVIYIADFFSFEVKVFLYNHFMVDANFGYLSSSRAYGLGAAESLLAINLFFGSCSNCNFDHWMFKKCILYFWIYCNIICCFIGGFNWFYFGNSIANLDYRLSLYLW